MKKLLLYDPLPSDVPDVLSEYPEWHMETVCSVSETLNHQFLKWRSPGPDAFVVRAHPPAADLAALVLYIRKYRPTLPVLLILENARAIEIWKGLLKDIEVIQQETAPIATCLAQLQRSTQLHTIK